jgi:hypothetical protein
MAEVIAAIGLAASVAGLVEIAGKSAIILRNTYQTMENAPSIVHTLCKDLDAFHSATQNLLSSLESFNEKGLGLKKKSIDSLDTSIKNSTATLSIVLQTLKLEKFKVGDVRPDITMGFKQKIQFVSKKKEIEGLLKDLDRQKGTLQFCLQVLTIE